ncbi:hypothetical protein DNU06_00970 [Putridiphycobacter roseus]|uniref:Fibronectin type-III domain-containing protein n=1 Tax=Putridiphycobacter roseus TaxID=2219161 RepID=A0A2W1N2C0_9FLAO|nr:T9SS type A sorting domain-containing protein [Putridiphycobacter roseus]PZE18437.1 hypothetical protein DNU06_00970 [Putridiphycobacter roseus]
MRLKIILFTTLLMSVVSSFAQITSGNGTLTNQGLPVDVTKDYTYSQFIYTPNEVGSSGGIDGLTFYKSGNSLQNIDQWDVFIGTTTKDVFTNDSDWVAHADLNLLYSGTVMQNALGEVTVNFTSTFVYNGIDNLVIAIDENSAGQGGVYDKFFASSKSGLRSMVYANDGIGNNPDPVNPPKAIVTLGGLKAAAPNVTFLGISTDCNQPKSHIYTQGFENYIPTCWEEKEGKLGTVNTNFTNTTSSDWNDGNYANVAGEIAAKLNISYSNHREWLISPSFDLGTENYALAFDLALNYTSNTDAAALDADDTLAFVISTDDGITWNNTNILRMWTAGNAISNVGSHYELDLSAYSGIVKIGIYGASSGFSNYKILSVDNFSISKSSSCLKPFQLSVNNLTVNSADLSWDNGATLNTQIQYGLIGFQLGSGTNTLATGTSYTINTLAAGATYQVYMRNICAVGDTSDWSIPMTISTPCPISFTPPYAQNFETYLPACWTEGQGTLGGTNTVFSAGATSLWDGWAFANIGSNGARLALQSTTNRREEWLISPTFDLGTSNTFQAEFEVALTQWNNAENNTFDADDTLAFVISTDNGVTWSTANILKTWKNGVNPSGAGDFASFDLSLYTGTVKFGFYVASSASASARKIFIDNFKIVNAPSCNQPQTFILSNPTINSISIDWTIPTTNGVVIEYGPVGFVPGTGVIATALTAPYTLTGIQAESEYDIYIRNICAIGDTSDYSIKRTFTTLCAVVIPPYYQDYSMYPTSCWERDRGFLNNTNTVFLGIGYSSWLSDGFGNVGYTGAMRMNIAGSSNKDWFISPTVDLGTTNTYDLTFDVALTSWSGTSSSTLGNDDTLAIVISTDNGVTWKQSNILQVWRAGTEPSNTGDAVSIDLSSYSGLVKFGFYAASTVNGGDKNVYIDNFRIDNGITCAKPAGLTVTNITSQSADVSWATGGAATVEIEYGPFGFVPGTGFKVVTSTNPTTLSGLTDLTAYEFYIRDICSPGDTSYYSSPISFTTTCPVYAPTYTQNFGVFLPDCWEEKQGELKLNGTVLSSINSNWIQSGFGGTSGSAAAKTVINGANIDEWLISPTIDLGSGAINYHAEFKIAVTPYYATASSVNFDADDTLAFVISTDNGITWTQANILKTWKMGDQPAMTGDYFAADLSAYTGLVKFGFYAASSTNTTSSNGFIDDFRIMPIPSCVTPTNISISNLLANSVDIAWTNAATNAQIEYGISGFSPGTGNLITTTSNPFSLSGLTDQTTYDYYVRTICGPGDTSNWSLVRSFTTPCPIFTAPYFEGYDTYPANCWTTFNANFVNGNLNWNNSSNWWAQDGFGNVGFTGAAKMHYWLTTHNDWLVSPSIDLGTSGNFRLEFDIALTDDNNTNQGSFDVDDSLFLYISTDDGLTWNQTDSLMRWYTGKEPTAAGDFISIDLSAYTGVVRFGYYARSSAPGGDINVYIDNFEIPYCPRPFDVAMETLTANSALISWNTFGTHTFIEYGAPGFTIGTGTTLYSDSSEVLIDGLTPITDYEFYLIDSCGIGTLSRWNGPFEFSTPCPNYIPTYTQDFTAFLPQCWEKYSGLLSATAVGLNSPGSFGWTTDGFGNVGTSGAARMNIVGNGIHEWLVSPSIDLGNGTTGYQVEFDLAMTAWSNSSVDILGADDTLALVISLDNGATWTTNNILKTWTYNNPPSNTGDFELLELIAYTGVVKFGLYSSTTISGNNVNVYVDNFAVKPIPPCQQPLNITIDDLSDTSVTLSWTLGAANSVIQYGTTGFTLGTGTSVNTTNSTGIINGLMPNTSYDIYILDSCGIGNTSVWSGPISIHTNCQVVVPYYFEGFSTYLPDCWTEFTGALSQSNTIMTNPFSSQWAADGFGNVGSSGAARMYVYSPGNGTPKYEWLVSPSIDLGNGTLDHIMEFDVASTAYLSTGVSNFDADDSLAVIISTDDGVTWKSTNILQAWTAANKPSNTGDHTIISLSGYSGIVKIGFYATTSASGGSANVYMDNFEITVCNPTFSNVIEVVCDTYTSPSGTVYTVSGMYNDTILNNAGCDSIISIDLTVNYSSSLTLTETRCESYISNAGLTYNSSGTYTELFSNTAGCDSVVTINLTIIDLDNTVSITNGVTLSANETQVGVMYQWLDCSNGNAPIVGATTGIFEASINGNYACEITKDSCFVITNCATVTGVGLDKSSVDYFNIYPNPNQGLFTITIPVNNSPTQLVITNMAGQIIIEKKITENKTTIQLLEASPGIYTVQVTGINGIYTKQLVVD